MSDLHLENATGDGQPRYWRSLAEKSNDKDFIASLKREFPEYADRLTDEPTRRHFLELMGASLALAGVSGCGSQAQEDIVPYVQAPEQLIPGKPLYYATAMTLDGAGIGLLIESQMGRPVKVEGNPLHPDVPEIMRGTKKATPPGGPSSNDIKFGATTAFAQAEVLSLYDPDRSQTIRHKGQIGTWDSFAANVNGEMAKFKENGGAGLRILTETVVSPTLGDQLLTLLQQFPQAQWHQYEPLHPNTADEGSTLAFGEIVTPKYNLENADVIFSLDADFLVQGPRQLRCAADFAKRRSLASKDKSPQTMNRLYAVESNLSLTGAAADERLPVKPTEIQQFAIRLAMALGAEFGDLQTAESSSPVDESKSWMLKLLKDLQQAKANSVVIAGRNQPAFVHALVHWMNGELGNVGQTVDYYPPCEVRAEEQPASLEALTTAMAAGEVQMLLILGGNPVFNAPADLDFAKALKSVTNTIHLSTYQNETSSQCVWHIPEAHFLESWSDTRAVNGTASIVQPLIAPLFQGKSAHEVIALLSGNPSQSSLDIVKSYWKREFESQASTNGFDTFWQTSLHDGIIEGTSREPLSPTLAASILTEIESLASSKSAAMDSTGLQIVFQPSPSLWDGRFANNGWLQELPQPFTKLTWDNAAHVAPQTAANFALSNGDVIEITVDETVVELPVFLVAGCAHDTIALQLGYGSTTSGRVGNQVGTNVFPIRRLKNMWLTQGSIQKTGRTVQLATTQHHHLMEGRNLIRTGTAAEVAANPEHPAFMDGGEHSSGDLSMYPPWKYDGYKWGMTVDLSKCTGCNACVVACQAENNLPIVGKEQVLVGREMHWLRIDHYYSGVEDNPQSYHQPVMCQHCELAPCEVVCPVAATTHSDEGLNEMTYNRCVGTRYCSNNCPYKVRRFNFFDYNAELRAEPLMQLRSNPDVTVRSRGVMEKCTYCVQRINSARIEAEKNDRPIADGEIVTACQAVCPSEAIVFGNLNDPEAAVTQSARSSLNFSLLGELNTRPRTNYLAVVRNPAAKTPATEKL